MACQVSLLVGSITYSGKTIIAIRQKRTTVTMEKAIDTALNTRVPLRRGFHFDEDPANKIMMVAAEARRASISSPLGSSAYAPGPRPRFGQLTMASNAKPKRASPTPNEIPATGFSSLLSGAIDLSED
jgi:hypothetical protein